MYFRLMGKLNARRNGLLAEEEKGFTLIELLVVVIIIGILAAIAIPVYLSVQNNAKDSAVQTDVTNLKTALVSFETEAGALPTTPGTITADVVDSAPTAYVTAPSTAPTTTWSQAGVTLSKYTSSLSYTASGNTFTITAKSSTNNCFKATSTDGVSKVACP